MAASNVLMAESKLLMSDSNLLSPNKVQFAEHIDPLHLRHLRINRGRTDPQMAQMYADKWGAAREGPPIA
jgi:hypothetical protein